MQSPVTLTSGGRRLLNWDQELQTSHGLMINLRLGAPVDWSTPRKEANPTQEYVATLPGVT